jgi:hypothetical protein
LFYFQNTSLRKHVERFGLFWWLHFKVMADAIADNVARERVQIGFRQARCVSIKIGTRHLRSKLIIRKKVVEREQQAKKGHTSRTLPVSRV